MSATVASAPAHKQMIAERRKRSAVWRLIHISDRFSSRSSSWQRSPSPAPSRLHRVQFQRKIAQTYIYKAPWFPIWLAVLCVQPFRSHAHPVAMAKKAHRLCRHPLWNNHPPRRRDDRDANGFRRKRNPPQRCSAHQPRHDEPKHHSARKSGGFRPLSDAFDAEATPPSVRRPRTFPVPGTNLKIVADEFSPNLFRNKDLLLQGAGRPLPPRCSSSPARWRAEP